MICPGCQQDHDGRGSFCAACLMSPRGPIATRTTRRQHSAPYQGRSSTSRAGARAASSYAPTQRDVIVSWIRDHGGDWTNKELREALYPLLGEQYEINAITARVNAELGEGGRLMRVGTRPCRITGNEVNAVAVRT